MKTEKFLLYTHAKVHGLRTARSAYSDQFAPDFNSLNLINLDELTLSNMLRELLDPQGSHAQGRKFVDLFIKQFSLENTFGDKKIFSVKTEQPTDTRKESNRYIDILIELSGNSKEEKFAIAIENKPWAADGKDQIKDYLSHLKKRYSSGHTLIYLAGEEGRLPANHSIDELSRIQAINQKHLILICYADLIPWLAACRNQCYAPSVRAFLESLEQYIRQKFMGIQDMTERQALITEATRSIENVEISLEIISAQLDIKDELINKLEMQLKQIIEDRNYSWKLLGHMEIKNPYGAISIQLREGDQYTVSFGFDKPGGGIFYYGIHKDTEATPDLPEIRQALAIYLNAKGKTTVWWPWYFLFEDSLRDWRISSKPWVQIASGEMAEWMIKTVAKIEQGLQENNLAAQLRGNGTRHK